MIRVCGLGLSIGAFSLRDVSLEVASGEYFILLGPTGSGKTLFLECLCGLLRPARGSIEIDGRDVTPLEPRLRGIGYVPQHQGLFPHLRVSDNIAFPLRVRRLPAAEVRRSLAPLVELLGIGYLLQRWPAHLSGGERQKVALARALAARPKLLLLDEPVSALDEPSRERLCAELRRIHAELRVTTIHVSHSVEEALSVGTMGGVLACGELMQVGTLTELLRRPATEFVARFFRTENVFQATARPLDAAACELSFAGHTLRAPGRRNGPVTCVIRPECLRIHPAASGVPNSVPAVLKHVSDRGLYRRLELDAAGVPLVVYSTADAAAFTPGQACLVAFPTEDLHILPS